MKLVTFIYQSKEEIGLFHDDSIYVLSSNHEFNTDMIGLISIEILL
jgi:hypothetical protein